MIVNNIIVVTFLIIIGTTFVISASQQRVELKQDVIRRKVHENNSSNVFGTFSNYGVVRRSLSPVLIEQYNIHYVRDKPHASTTINYNNNKTRNVIEKLKTSVILRDNILYIFSYLLHGCETRLTKEHYTSLQILYEVLKKKTIYIYNLLPILSKLSTADKNQQTTIILLSLIKNLPSYLQCTAKFLANEIEQNRIDLNTLLNQTKTETFNYLANINPGILKGKIKIADDEMIGYDKYSNITQKALGPVFVKLLYNLHAHKQPLSQELFGLILINLPNPNDDPVLEENIRYLYDLTNNNVIDRRNWDLIGENPVSRDAYAIVFSVLSKILDSNVGMIVKNAAVYVYHHLKLVMISPYDNPNMMYLRRLIKQDIDIRMLLSAIVPQEFGPDAIHLKNHLTTFFIQYYKNEDMNIIFNGFNKFAYGDPLDLLLAFLTRLVTRISSFPNTNLQMIQQSAMALLSILIVKKSTRTFTPFVSPEIDVLILTESLKIPNMEPAFQSIIDSIKFELIAQPHLSVLVSTLLPTEKYNCLIPLQCLMFTFQQIPKLQNTLPLRLIRNIQFITYILQTRLTQLQNYFVPQFSISSVDTNVISYFNISSHHEISQTRKIPSISGSWFAWDINNYYNMTPITQIELEPRQTTEETKHTTKQMETTRYVKPITKVQSSTTTNQIEVTVTPNKTTRKNMSNQPSSLATYDDSPEITKPSRYPTKQPESTSVTPNVTKDQESDKGTSTQSDLNKEFENQTHSHEERDNVTPTTFTSLTRKTTTTILSSTKSSEEQTSSQSNIKDQNGRAIYSSEEEMKKPPQSIDISGNVTTIIFPPNIQPNKPIKIQISANGIPIITIDDGNKTMPGLVLPELTILLQTPNINDFFLNVNTPIAIEILQPLSVIFGSDYIKMILQNDTNVYSTNIALLLAILKKAITYQQVIMNTHLMTLIQSYISIIEYVSPTILLPIIIMSMKLNSKVIYSTFSINDLTYSVLSEKPPVKTAPDTITIPLVNPKIWLQSINPADPTADLLPTLEETSVFAKLIQPLKYYFTLKKIKELFGNFPLLMYPNKGTLLITLLYKLRETKTIQSDSELSFLINMYIYAIQRPSINIHVSKDNFATVSEIKGQWQPELTSLIVALPTAKNVAEAAMIQQIEELLADPTLLEKLHIPTPPSTMTRGELMHQIILNALSGVMHLKTQVLKAFRYYKNKVEFTDMGALPIIWVWVETYLVKTKINLGNMIQQTINFDKLTYKEKIAYNDVITYLAQHPNLLQNADFDFQKYKTQGLLIRGLFKYLLKKQINDKIKKDIQKLLPHVRLTGPGAIAIPNFSEI